MSFLRPGTKSLVFVTHVTFVNAKCHIFCQVGDVGSQADTVAERVAESVETGTAGPVPSCNPGDLCLALFHSDNSWYRAKVLKTSGSSVTVFFIDYGNTETVDIANVRQANDFVLSIPALSTNFAVADCTPLRDGWTEEERKKMETMLLNGEFNVEVVGADPQSSPDTIYTVKMYNLNEGNTPIFVRPASSTDLAIPVQRLTVGQSYEVFLSYVESADKFWVQLKDQENDLNSLMSDVAACFAEDLPSTGDLMNPVHGQLCASCFSEDGAFYRSIVQTLSGDKCTVLFVDYGNYESKSISELFTLPQALCKLPMQGIHCCYNTDVNKESITVMLEKIASSESHHIMTVLANTGHNKYSVQIAAIEESIKPKSASQSASNQSRSTPKVQNSMWPSYQAVVMQVGSIYDVCISHVEHPGSFFVQLVANAAVLDELMESIEQVAHNFDKLSTYQTGSICLARFQDNAWYRGQVMSVKRDTVLVGAIDFGQMEEISPNKLKTIKPNFTRLPAQAVLCSLDFSKGTKSSWTKGQCEKFQELIEKSSLAAKATSKKGFTYQLDMYDTAGNSERHINSELAAISNIASATKSSYQSPPRGNVRPSPAPVKVSLPGPEASVGSKVVVVFTAVKLPFLYGQLTHTPVQKVAKLQSDLNTYFDKNTGDILQGSSVGTVCCTQYVDGGWYRGMIVAASSSKVEVAFADFGDSVMKTVQDLKVLPSQLVELPQQCILFRPENVPSLTQDKAERALINNKVEVALTSKEGGIFPTFTGQITNRSILEKLQDRQSQAVFKGASSRNMGKREEARPSPSSDSPFAQQPVTVGSNQEVMVTYVKDPSNFMIILDKMNSSLDLVMDQMHEFYDVLPPGGERLENPSPGKPCVAQFSEDKAWYRALITGSKLSGQVEVTFVDYGNNEYTDRETLKIIKQEYMSLPAQAILCSMSGVSSSQGFWSPEHIVQFEEMVVEQSFMAKFVSSYRDQGRLIFKVELVDKKGTNINQQFGAKTNTLAPEIEQPSRSFGSSKMGADMKITVNVGEGDGGWDESSENRSVGYGGKPSFGGRPERGGGDTGRFGGGRTGGFGGRSDSSGFGGRAEQSSGGFGGRTEQSSSGFGGRSEQSSGGFGGSGGFSSRNDSSGGFGDRSGGGGGSRDCFKCGQPGHISRECPNAAQARGGGGRECYKCGEAGHMARDCPNPAKTGAGGGGRECYKCGESGHMARDCTNPPKAGGGGGGRECYKCGETGHMARDCTNPGKGGNDRRGGGFGSESGGSRSGGFGGRGGGFGNKSDSGGGFGGKSDSAGGFGGKSGEDDWGNSGGNSNNTQRGFGGHTGGFGQDRRSGGGFGGNKPSGFGNAAQQEDEWVTEEVPVSQPQPVKESRSSKQASVNDAKPDVDGGLQVYELEVTDSVDVYVVYTNSPDQFWCQIIKSSKPLEVMMEDMNKVYDSLPAGDLKIVNPQVGMPCAAKFSEDNMWYRAEIMMTGDKEIEVLFLDYGNTEIIPIANVKSLKAEFMKMKGQGLRCILDGVLPTNKVWDDNAKHYFEELTIDKHLVARVMNITSKGTYLVDLENVDDKMNIAGQLAEKGYCSYSATKSVTPVKKQIVVSPYTMPDLNSDSEVDVYVSWIESPGQFWVQIASREDTLVELVEKVQCEYTTGSGAGLKVETLKVGDAVISPFTEDGAWYRGFVENITGDKCSVRFTDYGNDDTVDKDSLRLPTPELLSAPSEAAYCKLTGIRPLQGGSWTGDAKDIMDSLVKDVTVKCKVVEVGSSQISVELLANNVDISKELVNAAVARQDKEATPEATDAGPETVLIFPVNTSLHPGCQEQVYVSHTDSVASFWCQPVKTSGQLEELMANLEVHCQAAPRVQSLPVTAACAAKFSEDGHWYRAKVIAVYPESTEVLFVDYGNCEKVSSTDLCQLSEELAQLEPQAIECELENASKASNQLTAMFTELIGEQEVTMTVLDIQDNGATVTVTLPDGRSVGQELGLSTGERSTATVNQTQSGSDTVSQEKTQTMPDSVSQNKIDKPDKSAIVYPKPCIPSKPTVVFVSQVDSPSDFCLQLADQEEQLNEMMEKIGVSYESADSLRVDGISEGEICCSMFSEDGGWYRAEVVGVAGNNVTVHYVDYGNGETVTIDNIRTLTPNFVKIPPFALQCRLADVIVEDKWTVEAVKQFKELTLDKPLGCEFVCSSVVRLTIDDKDIAKQLVEAGYCVTAEKKPEEVLVYKPQSVPADSVSCYVSHVSEGGTVYLQLACEEEQLNSVTEEIQKLEKAEPFDIKSVRLDQCLCARFAEDQSWYRGSVMRIAEGSVDILFVDYGNPQTVTESQDLRQLTKDLVQAPPLSYACRLSGMKQLTEDQVEMLTALAADKEMTVSFVTSQPEYEIELLDENNIKVEEAIKPVSSDAEAITPKEAPLQEGEPDKDDMTPPSTEVEGLTDAMATVTVENADKKVEDTVESADNTVEETVKETAELTDEMSKLNVENNTETPEKCNTVPEVNLDKIITNTDQLEKPDISFDDRLKVIVSHADSPSRLWVQDLQYQQELDDLLNAMFELYSTCTDEKIKLDKVVEGQIVAGLYSEDESWYRGRVVAVKEEGVDVMFVDHGNVEVISVENLRKLPAEFGQLPVQGIPCCLGAVQPAGGSWSEEAIVQFNNLTQNKELLMEASTLDDGVYKVSLLDMGMSLHTLILEKGVGAEDATPMAVSTKIKQTFSPVSQDVMAELYAVKSTDVVWKYGYKLRDLSEVSTGSHMVVITEVKSPHDFMCRLQDSTYDYYQDKLSEAYREDKEGLNDPNTGAKCVVQLGNEDKYFHRASIISVNQGNQIDVFLVDTGVSAKVDSCNAYTLTSNFVKDPALAFQCSLSAILPVKREWDEESAKVFREVLLDLGSKGDLPVFAEVRIVSVENGVVNVELYIDRTLIEEVLVEKEVGVVNDLNKTVEDDGDMTNLVGNKFGAYKNVILDCDREFHVSVEDCMNLDEIVVRISPGQEMDKVTEMIAEFVKGGDDSEDVVLPAEFMAGPCLAKCVGDVWSRANLLEVKSGDDERKYQVFLVDYGTEYCVRREDLMAVPEDLLEIRGQAIICRLDEIESFDTEWSEEAVEVFKEHYLKADKDTVAYVGGYHDGVHNVLFTKVSEDTSANKLLVKFGLAAPVAGSGLEMSMMINTETSFLELSSMMHDSYGESSEELGDTSGLGDTSTETAESADTVEEKESDLSNGEVKQNKKEDKISDKVKVSESCDVNGNIVIVKECIIQKRDGKIGTPDSADSEDSETNSEHTKTEVKQGHIEGTGHFDNTENGGEQEMINETGSLDSLNDMDSDLGSTDDGGAIEVKEENMEASPLSESTFSEVSSELETPDKLDGSGLDQSKYSTTDVDPRSTGESDLDESYLGINSYSPTGYTTSELDSTDFRDVDTTTDINTDTDLDSTGITDVDTTDTQTTETTSEINTTGFTEDTQDTSDVSNLDTTDVDGETTETAETTSMTDLDTTDCLDLFEVGDIAHVNNVQGIDGTNSTDDDWFEPGTDVQRTEIDCVSEVQTGNEEKTDIQSKEQIEVKSVHETDVDTKAYLENTAFTDAPSIEIERTESSEITRETNYPSVSDTTYPSTISSVYDTTFTSVEDSDDQDKLLVCMDCQTENNASYLDTTGCESEFSFYMCPVCNCKPGERSGLDVSNNAISDFGLGLVNGNNIAVTRSGESNAEVEIEGMGMRVEAFPPVSSQVDREDYSLEEWLQQLDRHTDNHTGVEKEHGDLDNDCDNNGTNQQKAVTESVSHVLETMLCTVVDNVRGVCEDRTQYIDIRLSESDAGFGHIESLTHDQKCTTDHVENHTDCDDTTEPKLNESEVVVGDDKEHAFDHASDKIINQDSTKLSEDINITVKVTDMSQEHEATPDPEAESAGLMTATPGGDRPDTHYDDMADAIDIKVEGDNEQVDKPVMCEHKQIKDGGDGESMEIAVVFEETVTSSVVSDTNTVIIEAYDDIKEKDGQDKANIFSEDLETMTEEQKLQVEIDTNQEMEIQIEQKLETDINKRIELRREELELDLDTNQETEIDVETLDLDVNQKTGVKIKELDLDVNQQTEVKIKELDLDTNQQREINIEKLDFDANQETGVKIREAFKTDSDINQGTMMIKAEDQETEKETKIKIVITECESHVPEDGEIVADGNNTPVTPVVTECESHVPEDGEIVADGNNTPVTPVVTECESHVPEDGEIVADGNNTPVTPVVTECESHVPEDGEIVADGNNTPVTPVVTECESHVPEDGEIVADGNNTPVTPVVTECESHVPEDGEIVADGNNTPVTPVITECESHVPEDGEIVANGNNTPVTPVVTECESHVPEDGEIVTDENKTPLTKCANQNVTIEIPKDGTKQDDKKVETKETSKQEGEDEGEESDKDAFEDADNGNEGSEERGKEEEDFYDVEEEVKM